MDYYGEPPSYCEELEKCPVVARKMLSKIRVCYSQCEHKMHSLSIKDHNLAGEQEKPIMFLL